MASSSAARAPSGPSAGHTPGAAVILAVQYRVSPPTGATNSWMPRPLTTCPRAPSAEPPVRPRTEV